MSTSNYIFHYSKMVLDLNNFLHLIDCHYKMVFLLRDVLLS